MRRRMAEAILTVPERAVAGDVMLVSPDVTVR
jgi:hypothetical protein